MPQMNVNGTTLYYEMSGSGLPIVFIHDCSTSHQLFKPQADYFSKRAKAILYDMRGSGQSGKMKVELSRILDTHCEDLKRLLDKLSIKRAVFVACSNGAVLALKFAYLYPERIVNLVLVDSYFNGDQAAQGNKIQKLLQICAWSFHYLPAEMFVRSLRITYNKWLLAYHILRNELIHERTTESIKQRLALRHTDSYEFALRLQVPILVVSGNLNDGALKKVEETAAVYPSAHLAIIDDAMYPSHLCQPQRFNRILLDYLLDQQCFQQGESDQ